MSPCINCFKSYTASIKKGPKMAQKKPRKLPKMLFMLLNCLPASSGERLPRSCRDRCAGVSSARRGPWRRRRASTPGGNCIEIGLPGKSILGDYLQENRTSRRPLLLLRISFTGRSIFIQLVPAQKNPLRRTASPPP